MKAMIRGRQASIHILAIGWRSNSGVWTNLDETAPHQTVDNTPAHQRWSAAFVQSTQPLELDCLLEAIEWALEATVTTLSLHAHCTARNSMDTSRSQA